MTSLWARVEPLLARVQKPARYIGCEDGAITPRHAPGKVSWLLAYPDTYEIGLPNQGLQILYEILNESEGLRVVFDEECFHVFTLTSWSSHVKRFLELAEILPNR